MVEEYATIGHGYAANAGHGRRNGGRRSGRQRGRRCGPQVVARPAAKDAVLVHRAKEPRTGRYVGAIGQVVIQAVRVGYPHGPRIRAQRGRRAGQDARRSQRKARRERSGARSQCHHQRGLAARRRVGVAVRSAHRARRRIARDARAGRLGRGGIAGHQLAAVVHDKLNVGNEYLALLVMRDAGHTLADVREFAVIRVCPIQRIQQALLEVAANVFPIPVCHRIDAPAVQAVASPAMP